MASALVVSHPGHELRLFGWLARARPLLCVLTAGARRGDSSARVAASRELARATGCPQGVVFGATLDRDFYEHVLRGDVARFHHWTDALRDDFLAYGIACVVTDGWQFYNVAHDLTQVMARVAAAEASRERGAHIACLEYAVVPPALAPQAAFGDEHCRVELAPELLDRKLASAKAYPDIAPELAELVAYDGQPPAIETLYEVRPFASLVPAPSLTPLYETFGRARVAAGLYRTVLRWHHVEKIFSSLRRRFDDAEAPAAELAR